MSLNPYPQSPNKIDRNPNGQSIQPKPIYPIHPAQPNLNDNQIPPSNQRELRAYPSQQQQNSPRNQPYPYQPPPYFPPHRGNVIEMSPVKVIVYVILFVLGIIFSVTNLTDCQKKGKYATCSGEKISVILISVTGGVYLLINLILLCMDKSDLPCHQFFLYSAAPNPNCCADCGIGFLIGLFLVIISPIAIFIFIYFLINFKCLNGDRPIQESNINAPASSRNLAQRY